MTDSRNERAKEWLDNLLPLAGFTTQVRPIESPDDRVWFAVDTTDLAPSQIEQLIGNDGKTIDAIQCLANAVLNLDLPDTEQRYYAIDIGNYRQRRIEELKSLAEYAALQVRMTGREFMMDPLAASERRQVHELFENYPDLETFSRGQEPERRLVVKLASNAADFYLNSRS
jgi:spoIIIJ-associated protein